MVGAGACGARLVCRGSSGGTLSDGGGIVHIRGATFGFVTELAHIMSPYWTFKAALFRALLFSSSTLSPS
jgi:hypothetical protein